MTDGYSVTLCVPKTYVDAHNAFVKKTGKPTMPAPDNLKLMLDNIPGIIETIYSLPTTYVNADEWIRVFEANYDII